MLLTTFSPNGTRRPRHLTEDDLHEDYELQQERAEFADYVRLSDRGILHEGHGLWGDE